MTQSLKTKSLLNINPLSNVHKNSSIIGLSEKFINLLMKHGKKNKAYTIVYQALSLLYAKTLFLNTKNPDLYRFTTKNKDKSMLMKKILLQAIENVQPSVEVRSVKVSGRTYQVPSIIYRKRQQILAMRWIIDFAKERKKKSSNRFSESLAVELFETLKNKLE